MIFSDKANALIKKTINESGDANGVETEVVMINQNETVQKVSAVVESSTMPDALDMGLDLLLLLSNQEGSSLRSTISTPRLATLRAVGTNRWRQRPARRQLRAAAPAFRSEPPAISSSAATTR